MKAQGLTLIEILVALSVLAIGAVSLVGLQLATLKLALQTRDNTRLLHVADSELQQRLLGVPAGLNCSAVTPAELEGIDCTVVTAGCTASITGFNCDAESSGSPRRITVTASLADGASVALSSVMRAGGSP